VAWPSIEWAVPQDEMARVYKRDIEGAKQLLDQAYLRSFQTFEGAALFSAPVRDYFISTSPLTLEADKWALTRLDK
jgi:hypothetical protein